MQQTPAGAEQANTEYMYLSLQAKQQYSTELLWGVDISSWQNIHFIFLFSCQRPSQKIICYNMSRPDTCLYYHVQLSRVFILFISLNTYWALLKSLLGRWLGTRKFPVNVNEKEWCSAGLHSEKLWRNTTTTTTTTGPSTAPAVWAL